MNKAFLRIFSIAIIFSIPAGAQKGSWIVYGSGTYDNMNYTQNSNPYPNAVYSPSPLSLVGWSFNAGFGYELSGHFMIGLHGGYGKQDGVSQLTYFYSFPNGTYPFNVDRKYQVHSWQAGLYGRYTTWIGKRFYVYAQLFVGKYGVDSKADSLNQNVNNLVANPYSYSNDATPDGNGIIISLFPAIGVNIVKGYGVHLDIGGVSYNTYNTAETGASNLHHFNITLGQQFSFGIHKIIGWKKMENKLPVVN